MKKFFALLLVAALLFSAAGCMSFETAPAAADTAAADTADAAADATAAEEGTVTTDFGLFTWFQLALAVYLLYCVVTGRGKLFDNEYTKCDYKKYRLVMRILSGVAGLILLATCILELTKVVPAGSTWGWILWGVGLAAIIAVLAYNVLMTDRKAMAEAQKYGAKPEHPEDPLHAAFVFDEDADSDKAEPAEAVDAHRSDNN